MNGYHIGLYSDQGTGTNTFGPGNDGTANSSGSTSSDDLINGDRGLDSLQGRGGNDVCWWNEDGGRQSSCETFGQGQG